VCLFGVETNHQDDVAFVVFGLDQSTRSFSSCGAFSRMRSWQRERGNYERLASSEKRARTYRDRPGEFWARRDEINRRRQNCDRSRARGLAKCLVVIQVIATFATATRSRIVVALVGGGEALELLLQFGVLRHQLLNQLGSGVTLLDMRQESKA